MHLGKVIPASPAPLIMMKEASEKNAADFLRGIVTQLDDLPSLLEGGSKMR